METNKVIVQDAEALFLGGNFCRSLMLANQVLTESSRGSSIDGGQQKMVLERQVSKSDIVLRLDTTLQLHFDASQTPRKVAIFLPSCSSKSGDYHKTSLVDRAAAVALQSWYEIARRSCQKQQKEPATGGSLSFNAMTQNLERGFIHLKPFLEAYAPPAQQSDPTQQPVDGERPMPLDLAIVFLQFLRYVGGHIYETAELSGEILRWTWYDRQAQGVVVANPHVQECLQEIFTALCTEQLPFLVDPTDVELVVKNCLVGRDRKGVARQLSRLKTADRVNPQAISALLLLLDTEQIIQQGACLSAECVSKCQRNLSRLLKRAETQMHDAGCAEVQSCSQVIPRSHSIVSCRNMTRLEGTQSTLPTNPNVRKEAWSPVPSIIRHRLQYLVLNKDMLLQNMREKPSAVAALVLMMLLAWKRRDRLVSVSGAAVRLLLAPLREVVEAIAKPP